MLALGKELAERFQATTLVLGYEAIERFLKRVSGPLFFALRDGLTLSQQEKYSAHLKDQEKKKRPQKNTPQYFAAYVDVVTKQNCDKLLKELLDIFKSVKLREKAEAYWRAMPSTTTNSSPSSGTPRFTMPGSHGRRTSKSSPGGGRRPLAR
jgi:hypothetical protein